MDFIAAHSPTTFQTQDWERLSLSRPFPSASNALAILTLAIATLMGWGKPPSGSSLGFYATEPGKPAPITLEAEKTTKISAVFDDSFKMK